MNIATIKVSGVKAVTNDYPTIPAGIVGATVTFEFTDPAWDGLSKTAVFRGCVTRDVLMTGNVVRIPAETVAQACPFLFVGVYGTDAADNLVIPTLWLSLGTVRDAADPSGDPGTDPDLPIWAQLQDRVEALESGTPSDPDSPGTPGRPGEDGEDGGYYTPAVTQPSSDTVEFAFSPSKPDMPAVDPVQVKLPVGQGSGGNVELDTTLTQSGKAADAKAVGDKITEITGISLVEPAEDDMPKVFLTGSEFSNMTTAKNEVNMGLEYISKTDKFKAAIKIKYQGNTSLTFPKKNFTIKMYTDDTYEDKLKKNFKGWNHSGNKYVLKANYIDHSHARNVVSARLWGEVVASRPDYDSLPVELRNSPRNGAIDGFPVKLYVNGTYQGVYTWNVGKDDWMWGMDEDNANHVLMCAEANTGASGTPTACNFQTLWNGSDGNHWSVEVGTNSTALKNSLNNLIQFVMDNDGDNFKNGIGNYLDIQSAIDYYIFQYEICGLDGLGKNMLLATYDGTKWICGAYDMDAVFGLWWNGGKFVSAEYRCPEDYEEPNSTLWKRIEANYMPELKARQAELRKTVLSYPNMVTHFERFMDVIGLDLYAEDLTIYTGIPSGSTNNIKQIRNYIRDRQAYVDAEFAAMADPVHCTGISLNTNTLTFTAEGSQTLTATVTPDGCTDVVTWESNNTSVATVQNGVVTAVANGSAVITVRCGEYSASCSVAVSGIAEATYTELLYIESDGNQYIDTGVNGGSTSAYSIKFNPLETKARDYEQYFAGVKLNTPTAKLYNERNLAYLSPVTYGAYGYYEICELNGTTHTVEVGDDGYVTLDGVVLPDCTARVQGWGSETWYLFSSHGEPALKSSMRLYHCKMWKDGALVRDFIPAKRDADGAIGLLDKVTNTFFENQGTGTFISGGANIPCTGISLDKSALTFNGEGTQTLTATVTPDGCSDEITWESDSVCATVSDGVVTAIANGNATITVRCGNYSATCSVTVSGMTEFIYLYNRGDTCDYVTGGWNKSAKSNAALTFGEDSMYGRGCMVTGNKINLTNVTTLNAIVTTTAIGGTGHVQTAYVGIMSTPNDVALWDSTEPKAKLTAVATNETTLTCDVTDIDGEYYISVSYHHSNGSGAIYEVWLE